MNNNEQPTSSPFHHGEQYIQTKLGVRDQMEKFGRQVIRDHMPEQHQSFYNNQQFLFAGHLDQAGNPWASILASENNLVTSSDNQHLHLRPLAIPGEPLLDSKIANGQKIGLLGIELATRRRNRLATRVESTYDGCLNLRVEQSFGNCPQYIQQRKHTFIGNDKPATLEKLSSFDAETTAFIARADTFFVASAAKKYDTEFDPAEADVSLGADVSHRGGRPGFIKVENNTLTIPDFTGNYHFNTFGNFITYPKAGLLFLDFESGDILQLSGTVEIIWDHPDQAHFEGAERLWEFNLTQGHWIRDALPIRWQLEQHSLNNQLTGNWHEAKEHKVTAKAAEKLRTQTQTFRLSKIVDETQDIKSFYFSPNNNLIPRFKAGQHIGIAQVIGEEKLFRNYTISSNPFDKYLRISVKRDNSGVMSSHLHSKLALNDEIDLYPPSGAFYFNHSEGRPIVMLAAGIGITPMVAMLRFLVTETFRTRNPQRVILIAAARNAESRAFHAEIAQLSDASNGWIVPVWVLSQPEPELEIGVDYQYQGHISQALINLILEREELTPDTQDYYLCGPSQFMQDSYDNLSALGIEDASIFAESFGPSRVKRLTNSQNPANTTAAAQTATVNFYNAADQLISEHLWRAEDGTLLEFAERHGLSPSYGCRSGNCGSCTANIISGEIHYENQPNYELNPQQVCLCMGLPAANRDAESSQLSIKLAT